MKIDNKEGLKMKQVVEEPIWFEVESDDCKKGREDDGNADGTTVV